MEQGLGAIRVEEKQKVLVVDDDAEIVELLHDFLQAAGYRVLTAKNGHEAIVVLHGPEVVDCVLLDLMMPGQSGFEVCRAIRKESDVPLLMISSRQEDTDKIRGLGLGADDYIVKSATPGEIVARVQAVLRRAHPRVTKNKLALQLDFSGLSMNFASREVLVENNPVPLSTKEFELLRFLAEHPRQVFSREQLFGHVWGDFGDLHTVTVHIARLREKIEQRSSKPQWITTVWGIGYKFEGTPNET